MYALQISLTPLILRDKWSKVSAAKFILGAVYVEAGHLR